MIDLGFTTWLRVGLAALAITATVTAFTWVRGAFTERDELRAKVETQVEAMSLLKRSAAANEAALTTRMRNSARIQTVTKEVIREVPVFIPSSTPALPPGFRVLHDAAVNGVSPDPARGADAAPVAAQDAAATVIDNYGACHDNADQLEGLQRWLTDLSRPASKP